MEVPTLTAVIGEGAARLAESLQVTLGQRFAVACCTPAWIASPGCAPEYVIVAAAQDCRILAPRLIVVLDGACQSIPILPAGAVLVYDASDPSAAHLAAGCRGTSLGCGLGRSDVLTLSSITEKDAVISLRAPVRSLEGKAILPFELPVPLIRSGRPYALLACAAVLILSGRAERLSEIAF